jgi:hypothetical protein
MEIQNERQLSATVTAETHADKIFNDLFDEE